MEVSYVLCRVGFSLGCPMLLDGAVDDGKCSVVWRSDGYYYSSMTA